MAARKNVHSYRSAAYVQGNTVRKLEPERVPVRRSPDEVRRPAVNHKKPYRWICLMLLC